jgi:hypothetical protein
MYCRWRSSYQEERVGISLTGLTLPHFCACPKPGPGFPTSYVVVFFVFSKLRCPVIVRFVDIRGIVDHNLIKIISLHLLFFFLPGSSV